MLRLFTYFLFLFGVVTATAQDYVIDLKHWGIKNGLSHRQVNCLSWDRQGFLWIGTPNGLNRFDGIKFTWYTVEKDSLPFNNVARIAQDGNGNLWLASPANVGELAVFDPLTHKCIDYPGLKAHTANIRVGILYTLRDGSILVRTQDSRNNFIWHPQKGYSALHIPSAHYLVGFMPEKNLMVTQNDSNELIITALKSNKRIAKVAAPFIKGSYAQWHALTGLLIRDIETNEVFEITDDLHVSATKQQFPELTETANGNFFNTGIDHIVWRNGQLFHPTKKLLRDFLPESNGELGNNTKSLIADPLTKGRIWFANDFGLYRLTIRPNKFRQYPISGVPIGMNLNAYRSIVVAEGDIYCCNEARGIYKISQVTGNAESLIAPTVSSDGFYGLVRLSDGSLVGSYGHPGFFRLAGNGQVSHANIPRPPGAGCWYIREVSGSKVLCGMLSGLAWLSIPSLQFSNFTAFNQFTELAQSHVLHIAPDRLGKLWIAANKGFYLFDTAAGILERYSASDTGRFFLPAMEFQHFYQDKEGIYWLATTQGLVRWDKALATTRLFTRTDGLSSNNIYGVYEDSNDRLWMSSEYGIMSFHKNTHAVKTYLTEDGICYNEFNRLSHFQSQDGTLYFGSMNGITSFHPDNFTTASTKDTGEHAASVVITSFKKLNNKNLLEDQTSELLNTNVIHLLPEDRFLTLEFALLNYSDPEQTNYFWKIDGIDTSWNVQKDGTLRFGSMPYGNHVLHIKAQAADGTWSTNEISITVNVVPPFYLSAWFIIVLALGVVAVIIAIYKWRTYRLTRENQRLDNVIQEKTADLKKKTEDLEVSLTQKNVLLGEVHHRVKNNLQVISSLLQMQSRDVADEAAQKALIEGRNRIMTIAAIHKALYQRDTFEAVDMRSFADELFTQIAGLYNIDVSFGNDLEDISLNIDQAVPFGLILNELLTNSFKYAFRGIAQPGINIRSKKEGETLAFIYCDNGVGLATGIDIAKLSSLGMRLINGLVEQLNGTVSYKYENGVCFIFSFILSQ